MTNRRIGLLTMFMLVVLRMTVGWHFYREGMDHHSDPEWTSANFLRQAKGPLAEYYKSVLPDQYSWYTPPDVERPVAGEPPVVQDKDLQGDAKADPEPAWKQWADDVAAKWEAHRELFVQSNPLDEEQRERTRQLLDEHRKLLNDYLSANAAEIDKHLRERRRWSELAAQESAGDVPYQKQRVADKQRELEAEAGAWNRGIAGLQTDFHVSLNTVLEKDSVPADISYAESTRLQQIDTYLPYVLIAVGACLLLGLLTRTAAFVGALFLASVVLSQPPWLADAAPTYSQLLEMLVLLALATSHVGRWAGLDFFIHHLIFWPFRPAKGK